MRSRVLGEGNLTGLQALERKAGCRDAPRCRTGGRLRGLGAVAWLRESMGLSCEPVTQLDGNRGCGLSWRDGAVTWAAVWRAAAVDSKPSEGGSGDTGPRRTESRRGSGEAQGNRVQEDLEGYRAESQSLTASWPVLASILITKSPGEKGSAAGTGYPKLPSRSS